MKESKIVFPVVSRFRTHLLDVLTRALTVVRKYFIVSFIFQIQQKTVEELRPIRSRAVRRQPSSYFCIKLLNKLRGWSQVIIIKSNQQVSPWFQDTNRFDNMVSSVIWRNERKMPTDNNVTKRVISKRKIACVSLLKRDAI